MIQFSNTVERLVAGRLAGLFEITDLGVQSPIVKGRRL